MNTRRRMGVLSALLVVILSVAIFPSLAQQGETADGKKGEFHLGSSAVVGGVLLKSGMYQVRHITEGGEHVLVFREMEMGYRNNMGNQELGREVARVKCKVEPLERKARHTKMSFRAGAAGGREIREVRVAGESVKYVL